MLISFYNFYSFRCTGSYTPQGGPPSYPRTQESLAIPSVGTPPSVAPSPLPNPHSQPASVPSGDQTMPTLSPHPPINNPSTPSGEKTHTPEQPPKSIDSFANSPHVQTDNKNDIVPANSTPSLPVLKRPLLTSKEYEVALGEEEQTLEMLYDYSTMDAWLNHPVKKLKLDGKEQQRFNRSGKMDIYSLYEKGSTSVNMVNQPTSDVKNVVLGPVKQEIKQENEETVSLEVRYLKLLFYSTKFVCMRSN